MYSPVVFALSQLAAEVPYSIICAFAFWVLFYFPAGFNFAPSRAGYQFLMMLYAVFWSLISDASR